MERGGKTIIARNHFLATFVHKSTNKSTKDQTKSCHKAADQYSKVQYYNLHHYFKRLASVEALNIEASNTST